MPKIKKIIPISVSSGEVDLINNNNNKRALVEDEERFQNLEFMLIRYRPPDLVVQLAVRKWLVGLQTLVRERRPTHGGGGGGPNQLIRTTYDGGGICEAYIN
jgi:hypothetical protein